MKRSFVVGILFCGGVSLWAQQAPAPTGENKIVFSGSIRDRVENWHWFTPTGTSDPKYTLNGTMIRLGLSQNRKAFDWNLELEAPILVGLPNNAVAPGAQGALGLGANYYVANNRSQTAAGLFPSKAYVRFHRVGGSQFSTLRLGRFDFQDGSEVVPADATLATLKRERIQQRLLGPFVFTHVMRSFDGFHYVFNKPKVNYTLIGAVPTRGVFQTDGWGWVKTAFVYGSVTGQHKKGANTADWRAFAIYYDDWRNVVKTDNRTAAVRAGDLTDIRVWTLGAHYVNVTATRFGKFDTLGEFAVQTGSWGKQQQRAAMVDLEAGWQPPVLRKIQPWVRGGYYFGSGDGNPNDNRHGTFFQILPTPRPYARFPFFNMENVEDRFGMVTLKPHKLLTFRVEGHSLRLAKATDLWYTGGGVFQPWTFGYTGRSASGNLRSLANLYDANLDITVTSHLTVTPYVGYAAGRAVIQAIYPAGKNGHLAFLETTYRF